MAQRGGGDSSSADARPSLSTHLDQRLRLGIRPQAVLVVRMQVPAGGLRRTPLLRHLGRLPGLRLRARYIAQLHHGAAGKYTAKKAQELEHIEHCPPHLVDDFRHSKPTESHQIWL